MKGSAFTTRLFSLPAAGLAAGLFLAGCFDAGSGPEKHPAAPSWADSAHAPRAVLLDSGAAYFQSCAGCHGPHGEGERGPALANADYLMADRARSIRVVLEGVFDSIRVNGEPWPGYGMPGFGDMMTDFEIAAVLTYIRAVLNDSLVVSCIPQDLDEGIFASCEKEPRTAGEIAVDSIAVSEVAAVRASLATLE